MIRNIKITRFLIVSFAIVLILMNILGFAAIHYTRRLANQSIEFYEGAHTVQLQVGEVRKIMSDLGSEIKEAIIYKSVNKTNETTAIIAEQLEDMNKKITLVKERFVGDKVILEDADKKVELWLASISDIRTAMEAQNYIEALRIFEDEYLPIENELSLATQKISDDSQTRVDTYYKQAISNKSVSTYVILTINIITILITIYLCTLILRSIAIPLKMVREVADEISKGNLKQTIAFKGTNEFGQLAESMRITMETLLLYVGDIDCILGAIADHNLTVQAEKEYIGDFKSIQVSMQHILSFLNETMYQFSEASEQVESGSDQVAGSAQILSQGVTEQARSAEQLTEGLMLVSKQVEQNASYTDEANKMVETVGAKLGDGNKKMSEMLQSISQMNHAADQIAKIIKTIEDIAFQTNILALNAAVEAARAGEAGKGFAVVADEVRNLASKSSEAAKVTTELIQNSILAVENGTKIADDTARTIESVVEGAAQIAQRVSKIAQSSEEQADYLSQIAEGVTQINQVIQTNSATAEESAAASEELNGQAKMMKVLISKFHLDKRN